MLGRRAAAAQLALDFWSADARHADNGDGHHGGDLTLTLTLTLALTLALTLILTLILTLTRRTAAT